MKHENAVIVEAYDLASFVVSVAEHAKKGYVVDLQSNETYPQMLGINYFICGMKLELELDVVGVQMEPPIEPVAETTSNEAEVTTPAEDTKPKNPKFTPKTKKEPK